MLRYAAPSLVVAALTVVSAAADEPRRPAIPPEYIADAPLTVSVSTVGRFAKGHSWHLSVNSAGQAELTIDGPERTRKQFMVPKEQWAAFLKAVADGRYFELGREYGENIPDGSVDSLTVTAGRYSHTVNVRAVSVRDPAPADRAKLREASRAVRLLVLVRGWFDSAEAVDLREYDQAVLDAAKE
jgi:hypothetical protein